MRTILVCVLVVIVMASVVLGDEPAESGAALADVYGAFAPLAVLHRSYADYLFYGSDVVIPDTLASACDATGFLLAIFHLDLAIQTGSAAASTAPWLARLRADLAMFCDRHSQNLVAIAELESPDIDLLKEASDLGLFAEIYRLQGGLQNVFEVYLDGLSDEEDTWTFAVAFSLRTLLMQSAIARIEQDLIAILYGSKEATEPPSFVDEGTAEAIVHLVAVVDIPLDETGLEQALSLAQTLFEVVIGKP
jgi:hypothetical protein